MRKGIRVAVILTVIVLTLAGLSAGSALAQGGTIRPQHSDAAWQAWYWNNLDFSGTPVLTRSEADINYDWGTGAPGPGVNADHFTARWTRYFDVQAGNYRFTATSDDGIRVWVDNRLLIDQWIIHSAQTYTADASLGAGHHLITVEYFENEGLAVAQFSFAPAPVTILNWRGEYFNNTSLDGTPTLVRDDAAVNFNWGSGSPAPGVINPDYFSARWTRTMDLPAGNYRFAMTIDDGGRLWVNNHLLIDTWQVQSARTYVGDLYLPGGATSIKMEYYENNGLAVAALNWTRQGDAPPPPPPAGQGEVLVEDGGVGFASGGAATAWHVAYEGSGGRLMWTRNNDWARPNYNWARWYPQFTAPGRYEVYVYIPERYSTTAAANYWISHAGGYTRRIVNQSAFGGQWISLGTYWFRGTGADYVSLADVTGEPFVSRLIAFDAMKWVPR